MVLYDIKNGLKKTPCISIRGFFVVAINYIYTMKSQDIINLRGTCADIALSIRESQIETDAPIFVEEIIEDAEILFQYVTKGIIPNGMRVVVDEKCNDKL